MLEHRQRQAVHDQHDVRPAAVLVLRDAELVHREPVVGLGLVEVDHSSLRAAHFALARPVLSKG